MVVTENKNIFLHSFLEARNLDLEHKSFYEKRSPQVRTMPDEDLIELKMKVPDHPEDEFRKLPSIVDEIISERGF